MPNTQLSLAAIDHHPLDMRYCNPNTTGNLFTGVGFNAFLVVNEVEPSAKSPTIVA